MDDNSALNLRIVCYHLVQLPFHLLSKYDEMKRVHTKLKYYVYFMPLCCVAMVCFLIKQKIELLKVQCQRGEKNKGLETNA